MTRDSRRRSPAVAIAVTALTLSLVSPAYAAVQLARNSVGTQHLRANAVTSPKIDDGAVTRRDLATGARPKPPAVRVVREGGSGELPDTGWRSVADLTLPRGAWLVVAKGRMVGERGGATCELVSRRGVHDHLKFNIYADVGLDLQGPLVLTDVVRQRQRGPVAVRCQNLGYGTTLLTDMRITAVRVR